MKMLDISNICRICLKEEDPKLPIFTDNDERPESKPTLPEKIMSFARVKVMKNDGLPMYICVKCYCQVDTAVEFKRLCEESFKFFTQQLDVFARGGGLSHSNARSGRESTDGYDPNQRLRSNYSDQVRKSPTEGDISYAQNKLLPEGRNRSEGYEMERGEEEPRAQVFRGTGNESSIDNPEKATYEPGIDSIVIKNEPVSDHFEFDLSNVKIENDEDGFFEQEGVNPLEIGSEDIPEDWESPYYNVPLPSSNQEARSCHSTDIVFPDSRENSFHVSFGQTCDKYFSGTKDLNNDGGCTQSDGEAETDNSAESCHLRRQSVRGRMMWQRIPMYKVDEEGLGPKKRRVKSVRKMIKCWLCNMVCATLRGFKIHLTRRHQDYRIVYTCLICEYRRFFIKKYYNSHMTNKHRIAVSDDVDFELCHVKDCRTDFRTIFKRKPRKRNSSKTKCPVRVSPRE